MYKPQVPSTSLRAKNRNPINSFLFLTVRAASLVDAMVWRPVQHKAIGCSGRFRPFCQWTRNFSHLLLVLGLAAISGYTPPIHLTPVIIV